MPNVMAAQPNIGGAPVRKFRSFIPSTTPQSLPHAHCSSHHHHHHVRVAGEGRCVTVLVPCSNAVKIRERKTCKQSEFLQLAKFH